MNKFLKIFFVLTLLFPIHTFAKHRTIDTKSDLMKLLIKTQTKKYVLFGHDDDTNYGRKWWLTPGRSDVKEVCGAYPAVIGFDLGGIETGDTISLDKVPFDTIRIRMIEHYERGGICEVSWHLKNPLTGGSAWEISTDTVVKTILDPSTSIHHKFMKWLDNLSDFLLSVKNTKGEVIPLIFRPWHESSGWWFWWGDKHCTPKEYIALWKMTKDYLDSKGLTNYVYSYSPNLGVDRQGYLERYPGNNYVDLLGVDIYQFIKKDSTGKIIDYGTESFVNNTNTTLQMLTQIGKEMNKPIAFTETGIANLPIADWWTNVLQPVIKKYPLSYVLVWRNTPETEISGQFYAPFPGQTSERDFIKFYKMNKKGFIKSK